MLVFLIVILIAFCRSMSLNSIRQQIREKWKRVSEIRSKYQPKGVIHGICFSGLDDCLCDEMWTGIFCNEEMSDADILCQEMPNNTLRCTNLKWDSNKYAWVKRNEEDVRKLRREISNLKKRARSQINELDREFW